MQISELVYINKRKEVKESAHGQPKSPVTSPLKNYICRLSLEVYSFNPRAEKVYLKAGFKREGVLRDSIRNGEQYADCIFMAILEDEWKEIKKTKSSFIHP